MTQYESWKQKKAAEHLKGRVRPLDRYQAFHQSDVREAFLLGAACVERVAELRGRIEAHANESFLWRMTEGEITVSRGALAAYHLERQKQAEAELIKLLGEYAD